MIHQIHISLTIWYFFNKLRISTKSQLFSLKFSYNCFFNQNNIFLFKIDLLQIIFPHTNINLMSLVSDSNSLNLLGLSSDTLNLNWMYCINNDHNIDVLIGLQLLNRRQFSQIEEQFGYISIIFTFSDGTLV